MTSSRTCSDQRGEAAHHRLQRGGRLLVGQAEGVDCAMTSRVGSAVGIGSPSITAETRAKVCGVAGEPAGGVGAGRLRHHAGEVEPAVGRPDAVEAAEARRHAHRAAGVGAERGVAEPLGHRRGRARRRAAGHAIGRAAGLSGVPSNGFSPRMPSETSSVIVLPISVAPASSRRCTAQACRVGTGCCRAQSGLPPPVGWPATSKRSLAANVRPASGPPGAPAMRTAEPGTKGDAEVMGARGIVTPPRAQRQAERAGPRPATGRGGRRPGPVSPPRSAGCPARG